MRTNERMWVGGLPDGSEFEARREFSDLGRIRLLRANLRRHLNSRQVSIREIDRVLLEAENSANARMAARS